MSKPTILHQRSDLLATVEALRNVACAHAADAERMRTLSLSVVDALRASSLPSLATPEELGGGGHGPLLQLEVFEAMTRIDTSTGWALMITASLAAIAGAYLPDQGVQEVFATRSPLFAGLLMPGGVLRAVPGGFRVDGRWAFGSGIRHADFVLTGAVVQDTAAGLPDMRTIVVPAREVTIEDTWHAAGLRGSGSERVHSCCSALCVARLVPMTPANTRRLNSLSIKQSGSSRRLCAKKRSSRSAPCTRSVSFGVSTESLAK